MRCDLGIPSVGRMRQSFHGMGVRRAAGMAADGNAPLPVIPRTIVTAAAAVSTVFLFVNVPAQQAAGDTAAGNAVLQGVQIAEEPGAMPDEKAVTCYFIFSDRPSRYTYNVYPKDKQIVFTFFDAEMGPSPISSQGFPPLTGFVIEKKRLDVAAPAKSRSVDWHDVVTVTFAVAAAPRIAVSEEQGIISFSYKWTSDPEKVSKYAVPERKNRALPLSLAALGGVGIGAVVYILTAPPPPAKKGSIPYDDLPQHVLPP